MVEDEELVPMPITDVPLPQGRSKRYHKRARKLRGWLESDARIVLLSAPAGYGKTTTAALLADTMSFDEVLWLDCSLGITTALESLVFEGLPPQLNWSRNVDLLKRYLESLVQYQRTALVVLDSVDVKEPIHIALTSPSYKRLRQLGQNVTLLVISRERPRKIDSVALSPLSKKELRKTFSDIAKVELSNDDLSDLMRLLHGHPLVCEVAAGMMANNLFGSASEIEEVLVLAPRYVVPGHVGGKKASAFNTQPLTKESDVYAISALCGLTRVLRNRDREASRALSIARAFLVKGMDYRIFSNAACQVVNKESIDLLMNCGFICAADQAVLHANPLSNEREVDDACVIMHELVLRACDAEGVEASYEDLTAFLDAAWDIWCDSNGNQHIARQVARAHETAHELILDSEHFSWSWIARNRETLLWRKLWDYDQEIEARNKMCRMLRSSSMDRIVLRPAYLKLKDEIYGGKAAPIAIANAENLTQKGFAMRRKGWYSSARKALEKAATELGWDFDRSVWEEPVDDESFLNEFQAQLVITLSSLGYTYSTMARFGETANMVETHTTAVRLTRRALRIAGSEKTQSKAIALHYTSRVEYWLAYYMLSEGLSENKIAGRNAEKLLEDAIWHESDCEIILTSMHAGELGSVPPMDRNAALGLASALLAEICTDEESANHRKQAIRKLTVAVSQTADQRGKYSMDTAERALALAWMEISESRAGIDNELVSVPKIFAERALNHANLSKAGFAITNDDERLLEASNLCRSIELAQNGDSRYVNELLAEHHARFSNCKNSNMIGRPLEGNAYA